MNAQKQNILSKKDALAAVAAEPFARKTVSFYRYVAIADPEAFRDTLFAQWRALGVLGRIYVAHEGINAQINVPESQWAQFIEDLEHRTETKDMPLKIGVEQADDSFWKLTIKVKRQIVADDLPQESYDVSNVGTHLNAQEWNDALAQDDTVVVDMRNAYESEIGRFDGALCPPVNTFREELPYVREQLQGQEDKKVLLYCTGGVRCEKASAYLKHAGFKDVNQLYGGIINYAHEVKEKGLKSYFKGKNFVFDGRTAERITPDVLAQCHQCGTANDTHTNCANVVCNKLFLQCSACSDKYSGTCSRYCQLISKLPDSMQKRYRKLFGRHTRSKFGKSIKTAA